MPSIFRPKHRRVVITDLSGPVPPVADVTNTARCTRPDTHGDFCLGMCPRHRPEDYAENMARHATDSITPAERYHASTQWGR